MNTMNPNDLLTHKRFDVVVKYMYASNLASEFYKNAYKEHLRIWNGFYEGSPRKRGFEDFDNAFKSIDVIMTPTTRGPAFKIGSKGDDPIQMYLEDLFTISANLAGLPAMSLPNGNIENKPIGLQIIGNFLDESTILNFAHMFPVSYTHLTLPTKA
mgnify:CR=1 FL=1